MSRGNGKEQMYPEKEGAGENSPHKRLLKCATVANPLLQNPSAVYHFNLFLFAFGIPLGSKIDQIWNAFTVSHITD